MLKQERLKKLKIFFKGLGISKEYKKNLWIDYDLSNENFQVHDGIHGFDYDLENIDEITRLDLSFCDLEELPEEIIYLENLTHLNLSGNHLTELSENFFNLRKLTSLNLSYNKFEIFPKALFKIKALKNLNLKANYLKSFGKKISNFTNLELLDLSSNSLELLPKEIGDLKKLLYLDLSSNNLQFLVREITKLSKLKTLYLAGKREESFHSGGLEFLPKEIGELRNLKILDISRSQIKELPISFRYLKSLEKLYLNHSTFIKFPKEIYFLENLKLLDFSFNYYLDGLPQGIEKLRKLEYLILCDNNIKEIFYRIEDLKKLILFNIKNNAFLELPNSLKKIERFYYDKDKVKFISSELRMNIMDYNE